MRIKDNYLIAFSHAVIAISVLVVFLSTLLFPGGEWQLAEYVTEAIYLLLAFYTFYYVRKMRNAMITIGWSLFCLGLALDLCDEVSGIATVLHKNLEDWTCMVGIFLFALGFQRANFNLTRSLGKEQRRSKKLADKAYTDELTGIPNRACLLDRLKDYIESDSRFCLYFIDLNKFKPANDTYGHEVGDLLLQAVANRLSNLSRRQDFLARWGGDEFIMVLSFGELSQPGPMDFALRISKSFEKPFNVRNTQIELGASIGFSLYPDHGRAREELISKADQAMYQSKKHDGKPYEFDPSLMQY